MSMQACSAKVQQYHQKLKTIKIPVLFEDNILQEEYLRFLAVSAEIFHHKTHEKLIHVPKLLREGWQKHFADHHTYHDMLDHLGLPETQTKFDIKGQNCFEFLSLYAESFGYPLNSQVYETHLREQKVA